MGNKHQNRHASSVWDAAPTHDSAIGLDLGIHLPALTGRGGAPEAAAQVLSHWADDAPAQRAQGVAQRPAPMSREELDYFLNDPSDMPAQAAKGKRPAPMSREELDYFLNDPSDKPAQAAKGKRPAPMSREELDYFLE